MGTESVWMVMSPSLLKSYENWQLGSSFLSQGSAFPFFYNTVGVIAEEPSDICYYQTEMAWGSQGEAGKVTEVYHESDTVFFNDFATIKHYNDLTFTLTP